MSWEYVLAMNGAVLVPPGPDSAPVLNELLCEYEDPEIDSFCLHVTGEAGARLCGRWLLKPSSVGSFSGVEAVFEQNETTVHEYGEEVSLSRSLSLSLSRALSRFLCPSLPPFLPPSLPPSLSPSGLTITLVCAGDSSSLYMHRRGACDASARAACLQCAFMHLSACLRMCMYV